MSRHVLLALALLLAAVAAAPLKVEHADDFNAALANQNVQPVSFLQTAPAEPSSAAAAATPFYDPLMLGMMGFYPFMGYSPF